MIHFFSKLCRGKEIWNIICIPRTNTCRSLDMRICLQSKDSFCISQQAIDHTQLKENMASTKELSIETMEKIINLIHKGNPQWGVSKDIMFKI